MKKLLIFTDLDGTLLDHESYSYVPALPALDRLGQLDIPVIINSSKTVSEISRLRVEMNNCHPFIVENGGAACIPQDYFGTSNACKQPLTVHNFGPDYTSLCHTIKNIRSIRGYDFLGFSDLNNQEVADLTSLSCEQASHAKQRHCSEPIQWRDSHQALEKFTEELRHLGISTVRGGRFIHVMGKVDKAQAMKWLLHQYQETWPETDWITVALGDSPNDRKMLESADIAVIIPAAKGPELTLNKTKNVLIPKEKGPAGWRDAMEEILQNYI